MTALPYLLLALPWAVLAALWLVSHAWVGRQCQTVPEAAVRALLHLARWFAALAEALQSAVVAYRDQLASSPIHSRIESYRKACETEPEPRRPRIGLRDWLRELWTGERA